MYDDGGCLKEVFSIPISVLEGIFMNLVNGDKKVDFLTRLRNFERECTCDNCQAVLGVTGIDLELYIPDSRCLIRITCSQCANVMILHDPQGNNGDFDIIPDDRIEKLTELAIVFKNVIPQIMEQVANARIPNQHDNDGSVGNPMGGGQMDGCYGGNGK